jgi:hypothetical protein
MGVDARDADPKDVIGALDLVEIDDAWMVAARLRGGPLEEGIPVSLLPDRGKKLNAAFRNQIVGRIAERVFRLRHLSQLEPRYHIQPYQQQRENRDYGVQAGGLELPINVKAATTVFRNAAMFGLDPLDCIPISSYKALNALAKVPDLVYVDLVDFTLREKVDGIMEGLDGPLGILWDLLSWYGGKGAKDAQDHYVDRVFAEHGPTLDALAPGVTSFRVISARRVMAILKANPRRCPGLGVKAAGTGAFNAEVNVHVSVAQETTPWDDVAEMLSLSGIQPVLEMIRCTELREEPAPRL